MKKRRDQQSGPKALTHKQRAARNRDSSGSGLYGLTWSGWILAALIVIAGAWAYSNSLGGVFVLDDTRAIVQNETIRSFDASWSPPPRSTVSGRPFANFSFALNYAAGATDPRGYHLLNVAIHLAAALVLFGVIGRTLARPPLDRAFARAGDGVAAAIALLWVVHPLTTSAVTYLVQRVESLMALFYLLTLYCAIRAAGPGRRAGWAVASVASCALGMATKEVMVTAPLAVVLWDVVFRRGEPVRWGFWAALAGTWVVFAVLVSGESREASIALSAEMSWRYLLTQSEVIARYLRLVFVPSPLIFLYTWPLAASIGEVLPQALLVVALVAATIAGLARRHPLGYVGAGFFLVLAPTSSVLPIVTEVAAEHRMYLPLAAVIAGVVAAGYRLVSGNRTLAGAGAVTVLALALVLGLQTRARNQDYSSAQRLWADTVAKDPSNERARIAYGMLLMSENRTDEAEVHLRAAADLNSGDPMVHRALGQIYGLRRDDARAVTHLQRALAAQPDDVMLLVRVAALLADSNDRFVRNPGRAVSLAERAVVLTARRNAYALDVLAVALAGTGRFAEAAAAAQEGLALARADGNPALVSELEFRARAYAARARHP